MNIIDNLAVWLIGLDFKKKLLLSYKKAKLEKSIEKLNNLKKELYKIDLDIKNKYYLKSIFGCAINEAELIVKQYISCRGYFYRINRFLLLGNKFIHKNLIIPAPTSWLLFLKKKGFKVNLLISGIFWNINIFIYYFYGIYKIIKIILYSLFYKNNKSENEYLYFINLNQDFIPKNVKTKTYDLISSFIDRIDSNSYPNIICHSVGSCKDDFFIDGKKIRYLSNFMPPIERKKLLSFIFWSFKAIFYCGVEIIIGRWWNGIMLSQAAIANQIRYSDRTKLAAEYVFNNSEWIYRPLWTYEAEKLGSKVSLLFYSTNCEEWISGRNKADIPIGYEAMSWKNYYIWDDYQENFLKNSSNKLERKFTKFGYIGLSDVDHEVDLGLSKTNIAVFDVSPHKMIYFCAYFDVLNHYNNSNAIKFMNDIIETGRQLNKKILWKAKRTLGPHIHSGYSKMHSNFISDNKSIVLLDPTISAIKIIKSSSAVISRPYTSTALIAKALNIPSIYYDPSGLLIPNDPAAHGIKVVQSKIALKFWLESLS